MMFTDTELAMRDYLRTHQLITGKCGVFMGIPDKPSFPLIAVSQIGDRTDTNIPIEYPRLSLAVWGTNKKECKDLVRALKEVFFTANNVQLDASTHAYGITVDNILWLPDYSDPENKLSRYVVDITVMVRAITSV